MYISVNIGMKCANVLCIHTCTMYKYIPQVTFYIIINTNYKHNNNIHKKHKTS